MEWIQETVTATGDLEIERQLRRELAGIVRVVVEAAGNFVQALVLAGGFGRGEGGALRTENGVRVVNDYDFIVVVRPRDAATTRRVMHELAPDLEAVTTAKQVDMAVVENWKLLVPSPSVARYELRHGHRVMWGRIPCPIAAVPARCIPLEEGTKYLRNRGSGLLIARMLLDGMGGFDSSLQAAYARVEIDKATIAIGDAALIAAGRYHYLYQERRRRVLAGEGMGLPRADVEAYDEAVERKVRPGKFSDPSLSELTSQWEVLRSRFLSFTLAFEQRRINAAFPDMRTYVGYCSGRTQKTGRLYWSPLWSIEDKPRVSQIRLKTLTLLNQYGTDAHDASAYELWKLDAVNMLNAWHPGGIVGRIVADYV